MVGSIESMRRDKAVSPACKNKPERVLLSILPSRELRIGRHLSHKLEAIRYLVRMEFRSSLLKP